MLGGFQNLIKTSKLIKTNNNLSGKPAEIIPFGGHKLGPHYRKNNQDHSFPDSVYAKKRNIHLQWPSYVLKVQEVFLLPDIQQNEFFTLHFQ